MGMGMDGYDLLENRGTGRNRAWFRLDLKREQQAHLPLARLASIIADIIRRMRRRVDDLLGRYCRLGQGRARTCWVRSTDLMMRVVR